MTWTDPSQTATTYNAALPGTEFHVVGNVVNGQYIAGLIFVSQQSLNAGQGVISCIDYATGEMQIGGAPAGDRLCPARAPVHRRDTRSHERPGRPLRHRARRCPATPDGRREGAGLRPALHRRHRQSHHAFGARLSRSAFPRSTRSTRSSTRSPARRSPPAIDPACPIYNRPIAPNCKSFDPLTLLPAFDAGRPPEPTARTWVMDPPGAHAADGRCRPIRTWRRRW